MKLRIFLTGCLCFLLELAYSQQTAEVLFGNRNASMSNLGFIRTLQPLPEKAPASVYISKKWEQGQIEIDNDSIYTFSKMRYDIKNEALEIKDGEEVKIIPLKTITKFTLVEEHTNGDEETILYTNLSTYTLKGTPLSGVAEVCVGGEKDLSLLCQYTIEVLKPNYNTALSVGERNEKNIRKEIYFLAKGNALYKVSNSWKDICKHTDESEKLTAYIKKNKLKVKRKEDLTQAILWYNGLNTPQASK